MYSSTYNDTFASMYTAVRLPLVLGDARRVRAERKARPRGTEPGMSVLGQLFNAQASQPTRSLFSDDYSALSNMHDI